MEQATVYGRYSCVILDAIATCSVSGLGFIIQ